jgi:mono/diheme cytochrome c family protein
MRSGPGWVCAAALTTVIAVAGVGCSDEDASPAATGQAAAPESKSAPPATPSVPKPAPVPAAAEPPTTEQLIAEGRATYNGNCIACHAMDPTMDGALGPAVAGSSLELLEARVLRGEYPEGYEPKRPSRVMVPLPHLEPKLPALAAYLGSL